MEEAERLTCRVYYIRSRSDDGWTTRSKRGVDRHSYSYPSRALHNTTHARVGAPRPMPHYLGNGGTRVGSRRTPTVHTCSPRRGGSGWLTHETTIHNILSFLFSFFSPFFFSPFFSSFFPIFYLFFCFSLPFRFFSSFFLAF